MSKTATNGAIQTDNAPVQVTFELSEKDLAKVPSNIAEDQDRLNQFGLQSLLLHCGLIAKVSGLSDMQYVDIVAKDTIQTVKDVAESVPDAVKDEVIAQIGVEEGQALKPVFDAIVDGTNAITAKADELNTTWNLDSKSSNASQALDTIQNSQDEIIQLLDPENPNSIHSNVREALEEVTDEEGTLIPIVEQVVEDKLGPLVGMFTGICDYIKEQQGKAEVVAKTPMKGDPHEKNVHAIAKDWVKSVGGIAIHCGPDKQPGDTVLEVPMPVGDDMRIVIEAKDEDDTARGTKWIDDRLLKAMQHRHCDTALWIAKKEGGLSPTQIGTWGPGKNTIGHWLATTIDNENTALTYLRAMELINRAKDSDIEADIDLNALQSYCTSILGKLKKVQTINTKFGQISTLANEGKSEATDLRTEIRLDVTEIESIIKVAMSGGGAA